MKKLFFGLFLCLTASIIISSCNPEATYPSPLEGVLVQSQKLEADETSRTIEVGSRLDDVAAKVTDMATNAPATWLDVTVGKTTIVLKLQENITISDRKASVTLFYNGNRSDLSNPDVNVVFYVEQKRNKMFDGLNVEEVKMSYMKADTLININTKLKNVTASVTDKEEKPLDWCQVKIFETGFQIKVTENIENSVRQAFVRLYPSNNSTEADSLLAKSVFLVTQNTNPVLDSLNIEEVVMPYEDGKKVVKTNRQLKDIRVIVTDENTQERSSWCTAKVAGDSITLHANLLTGKTDRTAMVTLFRPNNGEVIDSATIAYTFKVRQAHNDVIENTSFDDRQMKYDQNADTMDVKYSLKGFKAKVTDAGTNQTSKWLQAVVTDHSVIFKSMATNKDKADRKAEVTLFLSNSSEDVDTTNVSVTFSVTQLHNDAIDKLKIQDQIIKYDQKTDTLKVNANLKGFSTKLIDNSTKTTPNWLTSKVQDNTIVFKPGSTNTANSDRSVTVILYQPNKGDVIDSTTISLSFKLTQLHNDAADKLKIANQKMTYNQEAQTVKVATSLKGFKARLTDIETEKAPKWLNATVKDSAVVLVSLANNMALNDRSAIVTIYQPNNGDVIDENTIQVSFKVTQQHNDATDTLSIKSRTVAYDQTADSLMVNCNLNGFKVKAVDPTTDMASSWLKVTLSGNKIVFKPSVNNAIESRSAKVILYQPNGNVIDENTIKHEFLFTQTGKKILQPEVSSVETDYSMHTVTVKITSNVKYQIEKDASNWILGCNMVPVDNTHENLQIDLDENKGITDRTAKLTLRSGELTATIDVKQFTNPAIIIRGQNFWTMRKNCTNTN